MKKIKEMIESAPTPRVAKIMLGIHLDYGNINQEQYYKGLKLIFKQFTKKPNEKN
jgi:hypothetical protein